MSDSPTLTETQHVFVVRSVFLTMVALGLVLGVVIASLVSMPFLVENPELQSDDLLGFRMIKILGPVLLLAILCLIATVPVTLRLKSRQVRRVQNVVLNPPQDAVPIPARLVRISRSRGEDGFYWLVYSAHLPDGLQPVLVLIPTYLVPPPHGSGAWLVMDPQHRDLATFATLANPVLHGTALQDPALANLTRLQQGLAVPRRTHFTLLASGLLVMLVSFGALFLALPYMLSVEL